jgi:hypothetical protein
MTYRRYKVMKKDVSVVQVNLYELWRRIMNEYQSAAPYTHEGNMKMLLMNSFTLFVTVIRREF